MAMSMIAEYYKLGMEKYRSEGAEDEWFCSKLTESLLNNCSSNDAFDAIDPIVALAVTELESDLFYDHIQFLIQLGRKANTSESPDILKNSIGLLHQKATKYGPPQVTALNELCTWFRLTI
ncbi:hypothetical protein ACU6U9_04035 [Pseudomonas sp. HK3]